MNTTTARIEALSAAVSALAAALPPDQADRAAQALSTAIDNVIADQAPALSDVADAAMAAVAVGAGLALHVLWTVPPQLMKRP